MTSASPDIPDKSFSSDIPAPVVTSTRPGGPAAATGADLPPTQPTSMPSMPPAHTPAGAADRENPEGRDVQENGGGYHPGPVPAGPLPAGADAGPVAGAGEATETGRHLRRDSSPVDADSDAEDNEGEDGDPARREPLLTPRHLRQTPQVPEESTTWRSRITPASIGLMVPVILLALLALFVAAWALDNVIHSNQVHRNVQVAGEDIGGQSEEDLPVAMDNIAERVGARDVQVVLDGEPVEDAITAGDLGLTVDTQAAADEAMDVGRSGSFLGRPLEWLGSFRSNRTVDLSYTVSETQAVGTLRELYGRSVETNTVEPATNPRVAHEDGQFVMHGGNAGRGLDEDDVPDDLRAAAESSTSPFDQLTLNVNTTDITPSIPDESAQDLTDELNLMTGEPLTLIADEEEREIGPEEMRSWITPVVDPTDPATQEALGTDGGGDGDGQEGDGSPAIEDLDELTWVFDETAAETAVNELFSDLDEEPQEAGAEFVNGNVEITESEDGISCCGDDLGEQVREAVENGEDSLEVEVEVIEPETSTEDLEEMGLTELEPIGGNRAWNSGSEVSGPRPGYTTFAVGEGGRAHNIGLMADQVNGVFIAPGDTWSINGHIGARSCPPYRDDAGAIRDNEIVDECGGGTSQFATTLLNAAYFAGLDVTGQAHSQYFDRYPAGREATMGAPGTGLDVTITNNTPYGVFIQSGRHGDEVTATIWSRPHATVEDLGNEESEQGECRVVTNTRQRTYPDGSSSTDTFTGTYRPGEGETC